MKIKQVYEKYKHLDKVLSDGVLMGGVDKDSIFRKMLFEFWLAIKKDLGVK